MQENQDDNGKPYADYKPDPDWVFRMRVVAGVAVGSTILWYLCGYLTTQKDFWTVFIGGVLTLFIIVAMAFQSHIASKQWEVMNLQSKQMAGQLWRMLQQEKIMQR